MATVPRRKLVVQYVDRDHNEDMEDSLVILFEKYGYELISTGYDPKGGTQRTKL